MKKVIVLLIIQLFFSAVSLINYKTAHGFATVYPTGTTIYKPNKTFDGYTLFVSNSQNRVILIDMLGNVVHYWEHPRFRLKYAEPLANGNILVSVTTLKQNQIGRNKTGIVEFDWESNVVWEYYFKIDWSVKIAHHDFERLGNGNTLILYKQNRRLPKISPNFVRDDSIREINSKKEVVWEWHTYKHFDEFKFSPEARTALTRSNIKDWAHTNSIQSLPENSLNDPRFKEGNILVSQRNTNIIFVIDKETQKIVLQVGPDDNLTIGQHQPIMIPEGFEGAGNIMVFDNGGRAGYPEQCRFFSRIIEIDPLSKKVVFEYDATQSSLPLNTFFSDFISGAQRLPNGNTLINEGVNGRFFEITPDGEIVWEYINPFFSETNITEKYWVYRICRVDLDWIY